MICPCGRMIIEHQYQTKDGLIHKVNLCPACGRRAERVFDTQGRLVSEKG